jgi:carboxylesterase
MLGSVAALMTAVAIVHRWSRVRSEHEAGLRLPRGSTGVINGAASIRFSGGERAALLLHGFGDTPQSVELLAAYLHARGWTVHAPLLPGHGRSLREFSSSRARDWREAARDEYEALRRRHAVVSLVGQSMGGALAILLAVEGPPPSSLVLLAPYLSMLPKVARIARRHRLVWLVTPYVRGRNEMSIWDPVEKEKSLGYGAAPVRLLPELASLARAASSAVADVRCPTLMVQSRNDNRLLLRDAVRAFERLGAEQKELVTLERCGHVITVDFCREDVFSRTERWMDRFADAGRAAIADE